MTVSVMTTSLRPETQSDEIFIRHLVLETAAAELGASTWPEPLRSQLLGVQYTGRRQSHRASFPDAVSMVIQADGVDAGRIVVNTTPMEMHVVEFMVLPQFRRRGIGTAVLCDLLATGCGLGKPVRLNVNAGNDAAIRLYQRLGFRRIQGDEVQHLMEASPL